MRKLSHKFAMITTVLLAATATSRAEPATAEGLAVGVEVGEPSSVTVGWFANRLGVTAALGTGTIEGVGPSLRADVVGYPFILTKGADWSLPLQVGIGIRHYRHGYDEMSIDEVDDAHTGVRASVAAVWLRGALSVYAELAPGYDLARTDSCNFASGADSICPHAQSTRAFVQFLAGVRWFIGR